MLSGAKPQAASNKRQKLQATSRKPIIVLQWPVVTPEATSAWQTRIIRLYKIIMKDIIKEIKLEIKRLKKLPDYEYVIQDLKDEIKALKKENEFKRS